MTQIVFHLGDHKTGSTAIQTTLASGSFHVEGATLLYPQAHRLQHLTLARTLTDPDAYAQRSARFREIREEIVSKDPDFAIISAEHFEEVEPGRLKEAVEKFLPEFADKARYIAYVRPHAERVASSFAERTKLGVFDGTMQEMHAKTVANRAFTYAPRFLEWRENFGGKFTLRPMVRDLLVQKDVVADLFSFVLGHENFSLNPLPYNNESVSLENLAILRRFQKAMKAAGIRRGSHNNVMGWSLSRRMNTSAFRNGTKVQIHKALAETVLRDYTEDAQALDAAFFTGTPMMDALRAAPGKALAEEQSVALEDHFSPREVYLIDLWIDQMVQIIAKDPDYVAKAVREDYRATVVGEVVGGATGKSAEKAGPRKGKAKGRSGAKGKAKVRARAGSGDDAGAGAPVARGRAGRKPGANRARAARRAEE